MVELIPRGVLFGNPERVSPRISPDGTRLAWLAPVEGVLNVWVANLAEAGPEEPGPDGRPVDTAGPEDRPVDLEGATPVTDDRDRGIRTFLWAHDAVHLIYLQDRG
ncbi:MAG TPA: hypothetical protein VKJ83_08265, partial [Actinomycetota bacterium]|nr:hypothetical protein [Actinomycetota bacterium]